MTEQEEDQAFIQKATEALKAWQDMQACKTSGRMLWEGLQEQGFLLCGLPRKPWPFAVDPACRCRFCNPSPVPPSSS
jgi:hypothetical protein